MYGDFQKEAKDYRPEGAVCPPDQRCRFLYGPARPGCKTVLPGNSSIRVRESKKEYGMSLIGISER